MEEVVVAEYGNPAEAEMWAEFLREQGVPSRTRRVGAEIAALGPGAWVPHVVLVRATDEVRARQVLDTTVDAEGDLGGEP